MLKRVFVFIIAACFIMLSAPFTVRADVLYLPQNDFYHRNKKDCADLKVNFTANGEKGSVPVKEEPGSNKEVIAIDNGETIHIFALYNRQGESWGLCELYRPNFPDGSGWDLYTGWIPMGQLVLVYDHYAFMNEYADECYEI